MRQAHGRRVVAIVTDGHHGALVFVRLVRRLDPRDRRPAAQRLNTRSSSGHGAPLNDDVVKGELPVRVRLDGGFFGGESMVVYSSRQSPLLQCLDATKRRKRTVRP